MGWTLTFLLFPMVLGRDVHFPLYCFFFSLKPFLCHIKDNPNISGVHSDHYQHKVVAYADNLLFFFNTKPITSLPLLLQESKWYSNLSNFKVNLQKTEALKISIPDHTLTGMRPFFPFKWATPFYSILGHQNTCKSKRYLHPEFPTLPSDAHYRS